MRTSDTWVCVADGTRAQFYRWDGPGHDLDMMLGYQLAPPCGGTPRVAGQLDRAAAGHLFEHLVLVGPGEVLGALRAAMAPATRGLVVGEVEKDLTHATPREVACHLGAVLRH